ncbi:hypothetical protein POUND7_018548 [Theobroma cacao]
MDDVGDHSGAVQDLIRIELRFLLPHRAVNLSHVAVESETFQLLPALLKIQQAMAIKVSEWGSSICNFV